MNKESIKDKSKEQLNSMKRDCPSAVRVFSVYVFSFSLSPLCSSILDFKLNDRHVYV